jgi:hypothetical protein
MTQEHTVNIMPQSTDTVLMLRLTGLVTLQDYMDYFVAPAKALVDRHGWYNLLVYFDENFVGWSPEAAEISFRYLMEYCPKARRLAYVNPSDSRSLLMKMLEPVMKTADMRFFEIEELDKAVDWMLA